MASVPIIGITSASAASIGSTVTSGTHTKSTIHRPGTFKGKGVVGTVNSVSGTLITITNKAGVVYTIDSSNATITKDGVTSTLASIAIGNTIFAQGTVTGTHVVAISINDGKMRGKGFTSGALAYKPMVSGTVSSVRGNIISVTGKDSVLYTVDGTNAKVMKSSIGSKPVTLTVSNILVGDTVRVQGILTGTNIVATNILDGVIPQKSSAKKSHMRNSVKVVASH
jgi:hypothetical protein